MASAKRKAAPKVADAARYQPLGVPPRGFIFECKTIGSTKVSIWAQTADEAKRHLRRLGIEIKGTPVQTERVK